ncbi:2-dehydropantoate 2-reductase [Planococcus sp. CP5-4]|uniref:ketopantoate reductase family protein n=1 Tax=unclassified Planococcus (in: firmicutes) TaxID=2662419 RepID=UPI001C219537|nr:MULTISPECIES: 2-dehydropantoate 2-reductase [unclassified Planococcus (in: firmicutes)]MBU9674549.1 2-dehydropantoate 2-reductase [Planococcus sp. CP5-4_YE]MBV0910289.1 2-dehydropantoate 2-reductase [Planococcus sp. CP5-4_UN]MBW6065140.1 2-dehydropantoate 2-reductase [Planococcus sp. CP5-4]
MKILIAGAGAMACLTGGKLKASGEDVCLYNRLNSHVETINQQGLRIVEKDNSVTQINLEIVQDLKADEQADILLVLLKAQANEAVLGKLRGKLSEDTVIVTMQNGIGNADTIQQLFPKNTVVSGTLGHGASVEHDGTILHRGWGINYLGNVEEGTASKTLEAFAERLSQADMKTEVSTDVNAVIWNKLFVNAAFNSVTALTRLKNGDILNTPEGENLLRAVTAEAVLVARAEGVDADVEAVVEECLRMGRQDIGGNKSSMLMDILKKRQTEIDVINGGIVKLGGKHGIETPVNASLAGLIRIIEQNYKLRVDEPSVQK